MICKCGGEETIELPQEFADGRVHIRLSCKACGTFLQWAPHKMNDEFQMPYGKYKGLTLYEIAEQDPGYLFWLRDARATSNGIRRRCDEVLSRVAEIATPKRGEL